MIAPLLELHRLLDRRERQQAVWVLVLMLAVAVAEVVGIGSVIPFIGALADPEFVSSNKFLAKAYETFGFQSTDAFLLFMGTALFLLVIGSLVLRGIGVWAQLKFSQMRNHAWSLKLVSGYLHQPYEWHLNKNTAVISARVLQEVNQLVYGVLSATLGAIAQALVALLLLALLIAVDPVLAISMSGFLALSYGTMLALLRRRLYLIGQERQAANQLRYLTVLQGFAGIKEVKLGGLETVFADRFQEPSRKWARTAVLLGVMEQVPSFAVQGLLFGGMLLALLYLMTKYGDLQAALPIVGVYAFAAFRLLPAMQAVYQQVALIRSSSPVLDSISSDFEDLPTAREITVASQERCSSESERIQMMNSVCLSDVWYQYPGAEQPSLTGLTIRIEHRTTIGLVGTTGAGKTTAVDVLLGLLRPQRGALLVDGREIDGASIWSWQRSLGYVPQQIFLSDDTVEANIAFGVPTDMIDRASVERAARLAHLHDFVVTELPEGYGTRVGERGVRLSGGQRQRIGIARAVYRDPEILVFDEATSALDNVTEQIVMEAIRRLGRKKTIIMIAHRLSTVRSCDRIFVLDRGRAVAEGSYDELIAENDVFRRLAEPRAATQTPPPEA